MHTRIANWLDGQVDPAVSFLKQVVQIYSLTGEIEEINRVQSVFEEHLRQLGLRVDRIEKPSDENGNTYGDHLVASTAAACDTKPIILSGHVDVVPQTESLESRKYDHDSRTLPIEEAPGRLIARGVYDMKGGNVIALWALKALHTVGCLDQLPIVFMLNSEEEIGCPSARTTFAEYSQNARAAIVFETGRSGQVAVARRKAWRKYLIKVRGKSAHAGNHLGDGVSAIENMCKIVPKMNGLRSQASTPGEVTANVGRITGGSQSNLVPDSAEVEFEMRANSDEVLDQRFEQLREICREASFDGTEPTIVPVCEVPPMPIVEEGGDLQTTQQLFDAYSASARKAGLEFELITGWQGGFSNANFFAAAGLPTLDALGVRGGNAHGEGEFIEVSSLIPRAKSLAFFLYEELSGIAANGAT